MQMQRLCVILHIDRLRRVSRGQKVRRVSVRLTVGSRGWVRTLLGREVGNVLVQKLVMMPSTRALSIPVVPVVSGVLR